jgi:outer membrane protein OmpA-like peptidoglycan-associated protein
MCDCSQARGDFRHCHFVLFPSFPASSDIETGSFHMKRLSVVLLAAVSLAACSSDKGEEPAGGGEEAVSSAPVAMEAGDSILNAAKTKIGATVQGEIVPEGGSNFFYFANSGKKRDRILVRLENKSTTLRPNIKVYNEDKSQIANAYDYTDGASVEQMISLDPGEGIYVEVLPFTGTAGAYELSAKAQRAYDSHEANDDQMTAATLKFGDAVEANIMDKSDPDWFHVTPTPSGKVTIAFENLSSTLRPNVKVYDARKSQVVNEYDYTNGAGLDFNVELPPGQDFYIQVTPFVGTHGKYRLAARPTVMANDMATALKEQGKIDLYGIYFDVDKAFIKPESANTLSEVASLLKENPSMKLVVSGHTDNTGSKERNMQLSKDRADAVVAALVGQHGIDPSRLETKGLGASKPVADNDTAAGKAKNRRVELGRK